MKEYIEKAPIVQFLDEVSAEACHPMTAAIAEAIRDKISDMKAIHLKYDEGELLYKAIKTWGPEAQTKMVLEEMAELQKEICKMWRGKDNNASIAEEIADVEIMLDQLKMMLRVEIEVARYRQEKLLRLEQRLEDQ